MQGKEKRGNEEERGDAEMQTRNSQIKEEKELLFSVIKLKLQLMCEAIAEDEKRMAEKEKESQNERASRSIQNRVRATTNACMSAKEVTLKCNNNCRKNTDVNRKVACTRHSKAM